MLILESIQQSAQINGENMFIKRDISKVLREYAKFPVVAFLGPRQSGKTTLVTNAFPNHTYISFEDPELRAYAEADPKRFLNDYENNHGIILDEFQYVPKILSYIQLLVDQKQKSGYFILTGSQNFLMNQQVTQSLAGRVGLLTLLPLSLNELKKSDRLMAHPNDAIFKGGYPRIYDKKIKPSVFYRSYIHTYLQRDVRILTNVGNLRTFQKFMALCAGRIGQLLNVEDIATNCGIDRSTVNQWLSVLEASYIIFLFKPHFNNFNKRLTKTPKLYFYDTGLACALLGIKTSKDLKLSPFRGPLFECFIIADLYKQYHNNGSEPLLYFWRDQNGRTEVDCVVDLGIRQVPIEIKSGESIDGEYFVSLSRWNEISKTNPENNFVIYGGEQNQKRTTGRIVSWRQSGTLQAALEKK